MSELKRNLENRKWLQERVFAEIVGPDPSASIEDVCIINDDTKSISYDQFLQPKRQFNGDEVLWSDAPVKRYGAGVLFPSGIDDSVQLDAELNDGNDSIPEEYLVDERLPKTKSNVEKLAENGSSKSDESDDNGVTLSNSYRPSAMGLSFLADIDQVSDNINAEIEFATYKKLEVSVTGKANSFKRTLWLRSKCTDNNGDVLKVVFSKQELKSKSKIIKKWVPGFENRLSIVVVVRSPSNRLKESERLITITMVNRQASTNGGLDELCFFQCGLKVTNQEGRPWVQPYPEINSENRIAESEDEIIRILYRDRLTFAIGHGCAPEWDGERPLKVSHVYTKSLPSFETASTSADFTDESGRPISVSMRKLAGLDRHNDGFDDVTNLVNEYEQWIKKLENLKRDTDFPIPDDLIAEKTASSLINRCKECLLRIKKGIDFLKSDEPEASNAREAFKLANHAMLIAQLRSTRYVREPSLKGGQLVWDKDILDIDPSKAHEKKGYWRPFQIAFLLMTIRGICLPNNKDNEREVVDLIWFPTGGGKTEAYLGLTAFTIFYNRISGQSSAGCDVIMRYTLRLLTAQQFQRAALLFCAMEIIRKDIKSLGDKPFGLGMYVGGDATPNNRKDAIKKLKELKQDPQNKDNPFILLKCPWCGAKFGPKKKSDRNYIAVYGYHERKVKGGTGKTVVYRCEDSSCEFGIDITNPNKPPLPISIIDEDIIAEPPNMLIGTVDKFAMLAWKSDMRSIFGIGDDGFHKGLPPSLIIQDELHLISGPLGSMVGAYETVIEELCKSDINGNKLIPKIVASTATISRAEEQVKSLYARNKVNLFPPSGLDAGDSFFSRESRNIDGSLKLGRMYMGVMAPAHGSMQTSLARIYATLLQYPANMPIENGDDSERDPWWTLLSFFNSIRELGGASSLLVSDVKDYIKLIQNRHGFKVRRQLFNVIELTSRIRSDHIPLAISQLEEKVVRNDKGHLGNAVEVCLASNIIEVGVDIDRLSLMLIAGQPKTTAQYIQVSSRVGRNSLAPGLDVVAYSPGKPRDRSHYERFRSYHQRLYAEVEPTSVTPFSPPAIDRALHGMIVAAVRQLSPKEIADSPRPFPVVSGSRLYEKINKMVMDRVSIVDIDERENVKKVFLKRLNEWERWDPENYGGFGSPPENTPLMYPAGYRAPMEWNGNSWEVMSSLRNVDATCNAGISSYFQNIEGVD